MTLQKTCSLVAVLALWVFAGWAIAADGDPIHGSLTHEKPVAAVPKAVSKSAMAQRKKGPVLKLVDINGASKAALKKLPGIADAEADKIIANRPYGSKTWLVTNDVLARQTYDGIKGLVEAKQPFKAAAENAAMYEKLKKEKAAKP